MPGILPFYAAENKDVDEAAAFELGTRNAAIDRDWAYYFGDHQQPLKVRAGQNDNIILNLCGQTLDKLVTFISTPRLQVTGGIQREPDASGQLVTLKTPEQVALEELWTRNDIKELMTDLLLSGMVAGHAFVRVYTNTRNEIEVALLDPKYVTVFWNVSNVRQVLYYRLTWKLGSVVRRQDIVPDWMLVEDSEYDPESTWTVIEYEHRQRGLVEIGRDAWPYPFAPIVEWKNAHAPHRYYGRAELRTRLNDSVNFVASNTGKIIKHHASPQTVLTGGTLGEDVSTGPGTILEIPSGDAKLYNLEMTSDLQSSMQMLDRLRAAFFAEHRVVDISSVQDKIGALTNFGVRMLFSDMVDNAMTKRALYGVGLAEVSRRALAMMGINATVFAQWDELLPVNRLELVTAIEKEAQLGLVSKQTAAEDLGRDFDTEAERMAEETTRAGDALANTLISLGQQGLMA